MKEFFKIEHFYLIQKFLGCILDFIEIQNCEPVEYSDKYVPSKYGIIFKEKIVVQPQEHTAVSLNIRLMKGGVDF